ncbi:FkbM family methyltransferase [Clostridia bacterium OttesenSCG-928-F22]|nr:FkbM family methyltransferase [Clostridia bacterium OttesenSCG-928-F22]
MQEQKRPIILYGMGNGADKIFALFDAYGITVSGIFASDEFVRGHSFHGYHVDTYAQTVARWGEDIIIIPAFASSIPSVMRRFEELDDRHTVRFVDLPVVGNSIFDAVFLKVHQEEIAKAFGLLQDEASRALFEDIISFRITGELRYIKNTTEKQQAFALLVLGEDEIYADFGAYNGDTIEELLAYTKRISKVIAVEPDAKNFAKLQKMMAGSANVALYHAAVWNEDGEKLRFMQQGGRHSMLHGQGKQEVSTITGDTLLSEGATYIKMDVEGAEKEALLGLKRTLKAYQPKLCVSAYHRHEDIFSLPLLIHSLNPSYKLYLRRHPYYPAWDLNIYAK